ncbi:MAG: serine hydrolase, partial [Bacteroidota bacterium]
KLSQMVPTEIDTFFRMSPIHGKVHDEGAIMMQGVSANAGLFSNAMDLVHLFTMLVENGMTNEFKILSPQTIDLFTSTQYPNAGNRRGLGFDKPLLKYDSIKSSIAKGASFRSYGHSGYTGTIAWADPENGLIFIFLTNRVYPSRRKRAIYQLNVRPTIHQLFYDYLKAQ